MAPLSQCLGALSISGFRKRGCCIFGLVPAQQGKYFLTGKWASRAERGRGRSSLGNISASASGGERWPMVSSNDISDPLRAFRRWGFRNTNVIGPNLPSNEEKRHPDALFSDFVIHSLLIEPLLCRLVCKSVISVLQECLWRVVPLLWLLVIHIYKRTNTPRAHNRHKQTRRCAGETEQTRKTTSLRRPHQTKNPPSMNQCK